MDLVWWVLIALVAVVMVSLVALYSRLRRLRKGAEDARAQMDAQLRRRDDLVHRLTDSIELHSIEMPAELEAVSSAHAAVEGAAVAEEQSRAEDSLRAAIDRLVVSAETHPDLRADVEWLSLKKELSESEGRVGFARRYYNERVLGYDAALGGFPSGLVAALLGFHARPSGP